MMMVQCMQWQNQKKKKKELLTAPREGAMVPGRSTLWVRLASADTVAEDKVSNQILALGVNYTGSP